MKGLGSAVNSALDAYFGGNWASIGGKSEQLGLAQGDYLVFRRIQIPGALQHLR